MADKEKQSTGTKGSNIGARQANTSSSATAKVPSKVTITDIAQQLCFWASQSNKDSNPITKGSTLSKEAFGKPKRLYSEIDTKASGDNITINNFTHKFPIREIFFVNKDAEQHTLQLANGTSTTFNTGIIHINAGNLELTRRGQSGDISVLVQQEANFDIKTGEITLRLKQDRAGLLYESKYIVKGFYTAGASIKLNPYTVEPTKLIQPIQRNKTFFAKLNKTKVNIYAYLNSKATGTPNVTFSSSLAQLQSKLGQLRGDIANLEKMTQNQDSRNEISQFKYVEKVLANDESLEKYKRDLNMWYENYKSWTIRPDLVSSSIEGHQYILEFRKTGKSRLSKYMERLATRTMPYDSRIVVTEDTELVTDYTQRESAEIGKRRDINEVQKIEELLSKATGRNNQVEIARYTTQLAEAKAKAKVSIEERMQRTNTIKFASGFGLYPPYLLSDILRYGSIFMKTNVIDGLALSSENIGVFADYINGFKSLVFNFVSLFNQLAVHKLSNAHLCTNALNEVADIIIRTSYNSRLYSNLSWLYAPGADGSVPTYTIGSDITQPLRFMPCMGSAGSFNILKEIKDEYLPKTRDLVLLQVDEPLYETDTLGGDIQDFDVIFAEKFKSGGILEALSALVFDSLGQNLRKLLEFRYDYVEDILPVEVDQSEFTAEDFPDLIIDFTPTKEAKASVELWGKLDSSKLSALASITPSPQQLGPSAVSEPVTTVSRTKTERNVDGVVDEDNPNYQDWVPVILTRETAASSASSDTTQLPIKQITREGKVKLADGFTHNYNSGDTISFYGLEGEPFDVLRELVTGNWTIELIEKTTTDSLGNKSTTRKTDEFELVGFVVPSGVPAPTITSGSVRKIPDAFLGSVKTHRDTGKDLRDKHVMSQSQWKEAQEEYNAKQAVKKYGFRSVEDYNREKNKKMTDALNDKILTIASKTKPISTQLANGKLSDETLFAQIQALKDENPDNFLKLTTDEIVKILKFKLEHSNDTRNINELLRTPRELGLPDDTVSLYDRTLPHGKSTVNGIMENAVEQWHAELDGTAGKDNDREKDKSKGKGNERPGKFREKYLKYKTKYLELKAKLGL